MQNISRREMVSMSNNFGLFQLIKLRLCLVALYHIYYIVRHLLWNSRFSHEEGVMLCFEHWSTLLQHWPEVKISNCPLLVGWFNLFLSSNWLTRKVLLLSYIGVLESTHVTPMSDAWNYHIKLSIPLHKHGQTCLVKNVCKK